MLDDQFKRIMLSNLNSNDHGWPRKTPNGLYIVTMNKEHNKNILWTKKAPDIIRGGELPMY